MLVVTPEMASDWLSFRRWPKQRKNSNSITGKYLKDMTEGRWKVTRQGLIFDTDGWCIDGQHRLRAVANIPRETLEAKYGVPGIVFWVYPNEPTDTFDAYDQNFRRLASHLMQEQNSVALAAAARFLSAASDMDPWSFPRMGRITTSEVLEVNRLWPELARYSQRVRTIKVKTKISEPEHLTVVAQAARSEHADRLESWLEGVHTGVFEDATDPRLKLRDRFMNQHVMLAGSSQRAHRYALIVKAWNAHAEGRKIPVLRWAQGQSEQIPGVVGFNWSDHKIAESAEKESE